MVARPVAVGSANLGGALGAIGGTLACLLCLAAIGALGLFACVIALAVYTSKYENFYFYELIEFFLGKFLNAYKTANLINGGPGQPEIGFVLLFASLFYAIVCRMQRN